MKSAVVIVLLVLVVAGGWALGKRAAPQGGPSAAASAGTASAGMSMGAPHAGGEMGALHGRMARSAEVGEVKVPKAQGPDAYTVAEIVSGAGNLRDKTVVVRGTVVRFTREAMGKNWVHLQDGSGSAAENTNDVLVTTQDQAKIGDVVVARGTVKTDVDLGSGYSYKVLVENATLQK